MVAMRMCFGGMLAIALLISGILIEGGQVGSILHGAALLLVGGTNFGFISMAYPWSTQLRSWRLAFGAEPTGRPELHVARHYFATMGVGFFIFGIAGVILGFIRVMENLSHSEGIGPGLAEAFASLLYGLMLQMFVAAPLGDSIAGRLAQAEPILRQPGGSAALPNLIHGPHPPMPESSDVRALPTNISDLVTLKESADKRSV